jgi:hypothetical protein
VSLVSSRAEGSAFSLCHGMPGTDPSWDRLTIDVQSFTPVAYLVADRPIAFRLRIRQLRWGILLRRRTFNERQGRQAVTAGIEGCND